MIFNGKTMAFTMAVGILAVTAAVVLPNYLQWVVVVSPVVLFAALLLITILLLLARWLNTSGLVGRVEMELLYSTEKVKDTTLECIANSAVVCKDKSEYCLHLLDVSFHGQTTSEKAERTDEADTKDVLNLGLYLSLLDTFLRNFNEVAEFTGEEEEYMQLLKMVAMTRKRDDETTEKCSQRLSFDSRRFVEIFKKRGVTSELMTHKEYWGSRQQMLSGKVIADHVDPRAPLDPIFGVLLVPPTGRVGPGDTNWFHDILFDDRGAMAYHAAVHDAFGYLHTFHKTGPGYDYLGNSLLDTGNNLAGQLGGLSFWHKAVEDVETKQCVINAFKL